MFGVGDIFRQSTLLKHNVRNYDIKVASPNISESPFETCHQRARHDKHQIEFESQYEYKWFIYISFDVIVRY